MKSCIKDIIIFNLPRVWETLTNLTVDIWDCRSDWTEDFWSDWKEGDYYIGKRQDMNVLIGKSEII